MWKLALRPKPPARDDHRRVKDHVVEALGRDPDVAVSVSEIVCADPGCPGEETVILVMAPGRRTAACKVGKALADVTEDDVRDALRELAYAP